MKAAIEALSQGTITADENSLYRALRRFADTGLVQSKVHPSEIGPPRRYFSLAPAGRELLAQFIRRNIYVFHTPEIVQSIQALISKDEAEDENRTDKPIL
jgi:DNA-binding PadR family transcriptional regulator